LQRYFALDLPIKNIYTLNHERAKAAILKVKGRAQRDGAKRRYAMSIPLLIGQKSHFLPDYAQ
jgi:hypothetical protein